MPCHDTVKGRSMRYNPGRKEVIEMEQARRGDLLAGREKAYIGTCQNLAGYFLPVFLRFLVPEPKKPGKNLLNHAIFWPGQARRSTL